MSKKLFLTKSVIEEIEEDGQQCFPNECCGFLYGTENENRIITLAQPVSNSKAGDQRRRFEISPLQYMQAEAFALSNDLTLLGIYHSHPNHPAIASNHDLAKALPFFSYVIISVIDGKPDQIKSWQLANHKHQFIEEEIHIKSL